ncbi:hypothetical protein IT575_04930 [bacterium]|nr:hypothetical protein [bacterium]
MKISLRSTGWLGLILLLVLASCGTSNVGNINAQDIQHNSSGVRIGGFEVFRYAADTGTYDSSLNDTISLKLEEANGQQALVISVKDDVNTSSVCLDVRYDAAQVHPVRAQIDDLIGGEAGAIEASYLSYPGVAGIGQAATGNGPANLEGRFATVYFERGAMRSVSASGDVYRNTLGVGTTHQSLANLSTVTEGTTASIEFTNCWARGDGDMNGRVNVNDLSTIGIHFNKQVSTNWSGLPADFNDDDFVKASDLSTIGFHYLEQTDSYSIGIADSGSGTPTEIESIDFATTKQAATDKNNATPGPLKQAVDFWTYAMGDGNGAELTVAEMNAADTNTDGSVFIFVTPKRAVGSGTAVLDGAPASIEVEIPGGGGGGAGNLNITNFKVSVVDGSSNEVIIDNANAQGSVIANGGYTFALSSISGTWTSSEGTGDFEGPVIDDNDTAFANADMEQADYDQAFAAAVSNTSWNFTLGGAAGLRTADDNCTWINFANPSPITGNPGAGIVFPDDDPESDTANPEGLAVITMPNAGTYPNTADLKVSVPVDIVLNSSFDVEVDPTAVVLGPPTNGVDPITELTLQIDSPLSMLLTWGTPGPPLDVTQTQLQLCEGDDPDGCWIPVIDFTFNDESVNPLDGGEFNVIDRGGGIFSCDVVVPGVQLSPGKFYVFRYNNTSVWSSLNKMGDGTALETAPPPPAQDLIVVPDAVANVAQGGPNFIQVYWNNGKIRRDDRIQINLAEGTVDPVNPEGYNDVIKDGDEFFITFQQGQGTFPKCFMIEGSDAEGITFNDPANLEGQFTTVASYTEPGRIVIDIAAIRPVGDLEGTVTFGFKFFNQDTSAVGQGTFTKTALGGFISPLVGVDWGVNAYNRTGQLAKSSISFADKSVEGNTVGTPTPDVIFAQFSGGWVFNYEDDANPNVYLYLENTESAQNMKMKMNLQLTGITDEGDYLGMHVMNSFDFFDGIGPGQLIPGQTYDVYLDYNANPVAAYSFGATKRLTVTSGLP